MTGPRFDLGEDPIRRSCNNGTSASAKKSSYLMKVASSNGRRGILIQQAVG
jgi:hypothetical protein